MNKPGVVEPRRALLVVDAQNDVLDASIRRDVVVGNIATLVTQAREAAIPVIWVRHQAEDELVEGTPGWQIVAELQPAQGEPVVDKRFGDSFARTDLLGQLRERDVDSIVLCGAQTDACIRSTFYGALYRGFDVVLVSDAHTTEDMRPWGATTSPEQSIELLNLHAQFTDTGDARSTVTPTADVLSTTR